MIEGRGGVRGVGVSRVWGLEGSNVHEMNEAWVDEGGYGMTRGDRNEASPNGRKTVIYIMNLYILRSYGELYS